MVRNILLLNASEEIIKIIDWRKAVSLVETGKAKKPFDFEEYYEILTKNGQYKLPKVLILIKYVYIPHIDNKCQPTRKNIFKRDLWTCQYCGYHSRQGKHLTIDHVYPRCFGGGHQWENLVTSCQTCNWKKGNMTIKECGMKLTNKPKKPKCFDIHLVGIDEEGKEIWKRWLGIHIR